MRNAPVHYSQTPTYLDWSAVGRGSGWRYLSGTALILAIGMIGGFLLGFVLAIVHLAADVLGLTRLVVLDGTMAGSPVGTLFLSLAFYVPLLAGTLLVVRFLHYRPALTVITPFLRLNWRLIALGAVLWLAAKLMTSAFALLLPAGDTAADEDIRWNYQPGVFWPALALACTLLVVQTSAEELLFRGYLLQWFARLSRNVWFMATFSGLVFAVPHLWNPEVSRATGPEWILALVIYACPGFAWAVVSIRSGTIESALGAHWLNNFVGVLVITGKDSVLGTTSLWVVERGEPSLAGQAVFSVLDAVVFILLAWRIRGRGPLRPLVPSPAAYQPAPAQFPAYGIPGPPGPGWVRAPFPPPTGTGVAGADYPGQPPPVQ